MSTEPSTEHVEAVAATFSSDEDRCGAPGWANSYAGQQIAKAILTSTDPAVWDAMQDALVRAGRLREEKGVYAWGTDDERNETRFVTEWQEVQP